MSESILMTGGNISSEISHFDWMGMKFLTVISSDYMGLICAECLPGNPHGIFNFLAKCIPDSSYYSKYGFCKKLLRYKWNSDQLNTFGSLFFPNQCWFSADSVLIWKKISQKCATGQSFIWTEVTSYKIHILKDRVDD